MGTWATFLLLGLYPVPATRQYLLSSPWFPKVSFHNPVFNSTTTIIAHGFDGNPANGTGQIFVQASGMSGDVRGYLTANQQNVTVNGEPWNSTCYIDWSAFEVGATIELQLTDNANVTCGDGPQALPPSLSTGGFD